MKSLQADKVTFPFDIIVNELEFSAGSVATLNIESESEAATWHINCWPEKVC